jgi:hypothetical protein
MPELPLPLPTNRAFVVQWRIQPPGAPLAWDGRVEHVVSGQMTHFRSLDELLAFICRVLSTWTEIFLPSPSMGEGKGGGEVLWRSTRQATPSPPSQPFPATASAEGAQFNVPPSSTRGEGEGSLYRNLCPST